MITEQQLGKRMLDLSCWEQGLGRHGFSCKDKNRAGRLIKLLKAMPVVGLKDMSEYLGVPFRTLHQNVCMLIKIGWVDKKMQKRIRGCWVSTQYSLTELGESKLREVLQ